MTKILVVDDERDNITFVETILKKRLGEPVLIIPGDDDGGIAQDLFIVLGIMVDGDGSAPFIKLADIKNDRFSCHVRLPSNTTSIIIPTSENKKE